MKTPALALVAALCLSAGSVRAEDWVSPVQAKDAADAVKAAQHAIKPYCYYEIGPHDYPHIYIGADYRGSTEAGSYWTEAEGLAALRRFIADEMCRPPEPASCYYKTGAHNYPEVYALRDYAGSPVSRCVGWYSNQEEGLASLAKLKDAGICGQMTAQP